MRLRPLLVVPTLILSLSSSLPNGAEAQVCECKFPTSNENGHIAGSFGGGLFAGLVAAVLHIKHQREATLTPSVDPLSSMPSLTPIVVMASAGALVDDAPAPAAAPAPARRTPRPAASRAPRMSAAEAQREGLVPPKTATLMPAFAMIGVGALLLGLFLLRERSGHRRWRS